MNYRHAFHAGNFADVMKHLMLSRVLSYLIQKPTPIRYIDTHAGLGWYDLAGSEAARTGEWRDGIGRLDLAQLPDAARPLFMPYLTAVGQRDASGMPLSYPGSAGIAHDLLRPSDRLLLCELHPADAVELNRGVAGDKRVKVLHADGYAMLNASIPPPERRGLVLIDPPFEEKAEFERMAASFMAAYRKWPTGTYALWYPIKNPAPVEAFLATLRGLGMPRTLEVELIDSAASDIGLRGSGLYIVNPPFTLPGDAAILLPVLAQCLTTATRRWTWRIGGRQD